MTGLIRAFIRFNKGLLKMPVPWQLWLLLLIGINLIVPLFFLDRLEARVVIGAFLLSFVMMTALTGLVGFTRLLGLGHVFWIPLVVFLWTRLEQIPAEGVFGLWIRALIAINVLSLVIDTVEVIRYIAGDREETVQGL